MSLPQSTCSKRFFTQHTTAHGDMCAQVQTGRAIIATNGSSIMPVIYRRLLIILTTLLINPFSCPLPAWANYRSQTASHVLVLHSFHPGYPWSDQIMSGIQDVLTNSLLRIHLDVEYLDIKSQKGSVRVSQMVDAVLHHKFEERNFDLVIAVGDEASRYALEHQRDLFDSRPVISCAVGIDAASGTNTLAIPTDPDYAGVIEQAMKFHPQAGTYIIIGGNRELSDRLHSRTLTDVASRFSDKVRFEFWEDLPAEEIAERLKHVTSGSPLLINGSIRDRSGSLLSFHEQTELLRHSGLPVYSFWSSFLGEGIVGGPLLDLREVGRLAAATTMQIISGKPIQTITAPKSTITPSTFDYRELVRLKLESHPLPRNSQLIHAPQPFYKLSRTQLTWISVLLAVSTSITLILIWNSLQRRKAQQLLLQSEQKYRDLAQQFQIILDGIPDSLTLVSPDMKVIWSNKGAGGSLGAPLRTVPGEFCCELLYNRTSLCDNCPAVRAFETGLREESTITTPDGRTLEVKAFPVADDSGKATHVIMLACDISDKIRLLEESLTASRLASLGELAAGVAHEINNPNAVIMLNIDLIKKTCRMAMPLLMEQVRQGNATSSVGGLPLAEIGEEMPLLLSEMGESANRIKRIVDDLKDFARTESHDIREPVDINEVVRASVRLGSNAIKNATDHFHLDLAPSLPGFSGSFQRIEQVVINLLMNACQSLPDKSREICVSTRHNTLNEGIAIQVRDQGEGIAAEILHRITDPFFTSKRSSGGTGLGLSISMRIIRSYGGTLEFDSCPGSGTTATIWLPLSKEHSIT